MGKFQLSIFLLLATFLSMTSSITFGNDLTHYRSLLLNEQYGQLEKELKTINDLPLNTKDNIENYYRTYDILYFDRDVSNNSHIFEAINKWIINQPKSAYAHFYLGQFYYDLGVSARGGKFSKDTPKENFAKMKLLFKDAEQYLIKSLRIDPTLVASKRMLINLYSYVSDTSQTQVFLDSVSDTPDNYIIWHAQLFKSTQRWGGGNNKIYEYLEMAKKHFKDEPSLIDRLAGIAFYDTADILIKSKEYDKAMAIINQAIPVSAGYPKLFERKARIYMARKDYSSCNIWVKKALQVFPNDYYFLKTASYCSFMVSDWESAKNSNYKILQLDGETKRGLYRLGCAYMELLQYKEAYTILKRALEIDPSYKKYIKHYTSYVEARHSGLTKFTMKDLGLFDFY